MEYRYWLEITEDPFMSSAGRSIMITDKEITKARWAQIWGSKKIYTGWMTANKDKYLRQTILNEQLFKEISYKEFVIEML